MSHRPAAGRSGSLVLVTAQLYPHASRLALAARNAGFTVYLVAPRWHPVAALKWVHVLEHYSYLAPTQSVSRALNSLAFDLVVPLDDVAAAAVLEAYLTDTLTPTTASAVRRSLGDPNTFSKRFGRAAVADLAASAGLAAPRNWAVPSAGSLPGILEESGFPAVMKADGSFAGRGVMFVNDAAGARAAYRSLARRPITPTSIGLTQVEYDESRPCRSMLRSRPEVTLQEFVDGELATMAAVAWEGELIGSLGFRVVNTFKQTGPSTVVEPIQHPDMERAAEVLARRLGLSGLFGLDFILSPDRATASVLELNPRAVPTAHISLPWQSRPLLHLLADRVGVDAPPPPAPYPADVIALFPQAWRPEARRDSAMYGDADVPDAEDVAALCLASVVDGVHLKFARRIRVGLRPPAKRGRTIDMPMAEQDVAELAEPERVL